MNTAYTMIDELYRYNDWANGRLLRMCYGLDDAQLNQPREIGFGTLRATVFHILAAEEIWLERWQGQPWRPFPFEPLDTPIGEIDYRIRRVAEERNRFLEQDRGEGWQREITFLDSAQKAHTRRLQDVLIHVANHGIHHRAQALHFLKNCGRTVPVGLDYLVYKLAYPSVPQDAPAIESMRQYGLEVCAGTGTRLRLHLPHLQDYYAYHDWAMEFLVASASKLNDAALDQDFGMGSGSIRKTLLHLFDVEPYWLANWKGELLSPPQLDPTRSLAAGAGAWRDAVGRRNAVVSALTQEGADRIVQIAFGGPPIKFRMVETMLQVCVHGTHHRAQIVNMLRRSGVTLPNIDYSVWIAQR